jgi:hypothetical protein
VIFRHALASEDKHVAEALNRDMSIAVGMLPCTGAEYTQKRAHYLEVLPKATLTVFDATTHPLGAPDLSLDP